MKGSVRHTSTSDRQQIPGCIQAGDLSPPPGCYPASQSGATSRIQILCRRTEPDPVEYSFVDRAAGWLLDGSPIGGGRAPEFTIRGGCGSLFFHGPSVFLTQVYVS